MNRAQYREQIRTFRVVGEKTSLKVGVLQLTVYRTEWSLWHLGKGDYIDADRTKSVERAHAGVVNRALKWVAANVPKQGPGL